MSLNDVFECIVQMFGPDGQILINTFHYVDDSGGGIMAPADVNAGFIGVIFSSFQAAICPEVQFGLITTTMLVGANPGDQSVSTAHFGDMGSSAGTAITMQCCGVIKRWKNPRTRGNRGRVYISGIKETSVGVSGNFTTYAAFDNLVAAVKAPITLVAGTLNPALVRRSDLSWVVITDTSSALYVGSQRRRRVGFGI